MRRSMEHPVRAGDSLGHRFMPKVAAGALVLALSASAFLLTGCAATVVKRDKPFVLEKKSVVVLRQGHELQAHRVAVESDSLAVTGRFSGVETRIPLRAVKRVEEIDAFKGMFKGAGAGIGIGFVAGGLLGVSLPDCPEESESCLNFDPATKFILMGVAGASIGAGAGALYGLLRGRGAAYRFEGFGEQEGDKDSLPVLAPEVAGVMDSARSPAPEQSPSQDPEHASVTTGPPAPLPPSSSPVPVHEWDAREAVAKDTVREPYVRGRFYLGVDFGYALGKMPSGPGAQVGNTLAPGWFIPMHFGVNIDPHWSAGLRYTVGEMQHRYTVKRASGPFGDGPLHDFEVWDGSFMHAYEAEVRWYPHEKGLFLKGTAGILSYEYYDGSDENLWYREKGFTASAGAGYAWNAWSIVNLVAGADLVGGVSSNGSGSWMVRPSLGVTFQ